MAEWRVSNYRPVTEVQLEAIKLVGARRVAKLGLVSIEPAYGLEVIRSIAACVRPEELVATQRLFQDAGVSGPGADILLDKKKIVRAPLEDGGGIQLVPRIPGLDDDNLSNYAATVDEDDAHDVLTVEARALVYKLNTLFTDVTLQDKLRLSARRLQAAKRLATSDPGAAARSLTDAIRVKGFPNCRVIAGDYAKSLTRAKEVIHQWALTVEYRDTAIPSTVTPDKIIMSYNAFDGPNLWSAIGPVKYATEVQCVYQLAIHHGPDYVLFLLGLETAVLGINIYNDRIREYYTGRVAGYSSMEGIKPMASGFPSELTAEQKSKMYMLSSKVLPVECSGSVVGTAVRVSDRHVLVNSHTLGMISDTGERGVIAGEEILASRSVAYDLSVLDRRGGEAQWTLRDPIVNEKVVLVYSVGTTVEYTEVLRVLSVHQDNIVLSQSNILRRGASGAVVVALRDYAMLGMFVTVRGYNVICASFSTRHFSKVTETDSVLSVGDDTSQAVGVGQATYRRMLRRGLGSYLEVINSSATSVYTKTASSYTLAGTIANYAGNWHTTVDPRHDQLYLSNKQPLLLEGVAQDLYRCIDPLPILSEVPSVRTVVPGERVCVFARDGEEVIMSKVVPVVHYTVNASCFSIEAIGDTTEVLAGGLIVSERDAAVLGQYIGERENAFGEMCGICVCVPSQTTMSPIESQSSFTATYVCVKLLTGELGGMHEDADYYRTIGQSAVGISVAQLNRSVGDGRLSAPQVTDITENMSKKMCQWLADDLGVSRDKLDIVPALHARIHWILGYLYTDMHQWYDAAVRVLYSVTSYEPSSATSSRSVPLNYEPLGTTSPVLSRTYSAEIVDLRQELNALRAVINKQPDSGG